jgi:hypothetical protein
MFLWFRRHVLLVSFDRVCGVIEYALFYSYPEVRRYFPRYQCFLDFGP